MKKKISDEGQSQQKKVSHQLMNQTLGIYYFQFLGILHVKTGPAEQEGPYLEDRTEKVECASLNWISQALGRGASNSFIGLRDDSRELASILQANSLKLGLCNQMTFLCGINRLGVPGGQQVSNKTIWFIIKLSFKHLITTNCVVKLHPRTKWRATPHTSIRN
jgi:hypothetical protein